MFVTKFKLRCRLMMMQQRNGVTDLHSERRLSCLLSLMPMCAKGSSTTGNATVCRCLVRKVKCTASPLARILRALKTKYT
jgi:hypothetical protein